MPTLTLSKTYNDTEILDASDISNWLDDLETFLNSTKLTDSNIATSGISTTSIETASVSTAKIAANAVTSVKIAGGAVTTAKIADSAVTTAKIADSAVTTAKIADSAVTTSEINALAVTTAKFADGSVTSSKLAAANIATSSSASGTFSQAMTSSISITTVTNMTVDLTVSGSRPVFVGLMPTATSFTDASLLAMHHELAAAENSTDMACTLYFYRDSTQIHVSRFRTSRSFSETIGSGTYEDLAGTDATWNAMASFGGMFIIDGITPPSGLPTAGTRTYTFRIDDAAVGNTYTELVVRNFKLVAFEL